MCWPVDRDGSPAPLLLQREQEIVLCPSKFWPIPK